MYERFNESFKEINVLYIIGYSYRDTHINKIIKEALDKYDFQVVNVNPDIDFPFRKKYLQENVNNIKDVNCLSINKL